MGEKRGSALAENSDWLGSGRVKFFFSVGYRYDTVESKCFDWIIIWNFLPDPHKTPIRIPNAWKIFCLISIFRTGTGELAYRCQVLCIKTSTLNTGALQYRYRYR
jgi:hypothetical protein